MVFINFEIVAGSGVGIGTCCTFLGGGLSEVSYRDCLLFNFFCDKKEQLLIAVLPGAFISWFFILLIFLVMVYNQGKDTKADVDVPGKGGNFGSCLVWWGRWIAHGRGMSGGTGGRRKPWPFSECIFFG